MSKKPNQFQVTDAAAPQDASAATETAAPSSAERKWPKGRELRERIAVACKLGVLTYRHIYDLLGAIEVGEEAQAMQLLAFESDIDLRDDRFTFKAMMAAGKK